LADQGLRAPAGLHVYGLALDDEAAAALRMSATLRLEAMWPLADAKDDSVSPDCPVDVSNTMPDTGRGFIVDMASAEVGVEEAPSDTNYCREQPSWWPAGFFDVFSSEEAAVDGLDLFWADEGATDIHTLKAKLGRTDR